MKKDKIMKTKQTIFKKNSALTVAVYTSHAGSKEFSLIDKKIYNVLLWNAALQKQQSESPINVYSIEFSEIRKKIGREIKTNRIKKAFPALGRVEVKGNFLGKVKADKVGYAKFTNFNLLSEFTDHENGYSYAFSPTLDKLISDPDMIYSLLDLDNIAKLNSYHSLSIYELCFEYSGINATPWISINELKELTNTSGKYPELYDLKKRVITPAIKDINDNTDLAIDVEFEKTGHRFTELRFTINKKPKAKPAPALTFKPIPKYEAPSPLDGYEEAAIYQLSIKAKNQQAYRAKVMKNYLNDDAGTVDLIKTQIKNMKNSSGLASCVGQKIKTDKYEILFLYYFEEHELLRIKSNGDISGIITTHNEKYIYDQIKSALYVTDHFNKNSFKNEIGASMAKGNTNVVITDIAFADTYDYENFGKISYTIKDTGEKIVENTTASIIESIIQARNEQMKQ